MKALRLLGLARFPVSLLITQVREEVSAGKKGPEGATAASCDVCLFVAQKVDAGTHRTLRSKRQYLRAGREEPTYNCGYKKRERTPTKENNERSLTSRVVGRDQRGLVL